MLKFLKADTTLCCNAAKEWHHIGFLCRIERDGLRGWRLVVPTEAGRNEGLFPIVHCPWCGKKLP